jgi:MEMO1 family protein
MLIHGIFTPHPPAIIPAIGGEEVQKFEKTIQALLSVSLKLKQNPPQTLVVLTPHAEIEVDRFAVRIPKGENFTADFTEFEAEDEPKTYPRDRLLTSQIIEGIHSTGMQTSVLENEKLDFGSSVPLHYLAAALPEVEIVNLGVSFAGIPEHQKLGNLIREVAEKSEKKIALVASGELSHQVTKNSPHGFLPAGVEWDAQIVESLKAGEFENILQQDVFDLDEIEECGFRSLVTLISAFEKIPNTHEFLSYEAPGGIGCAVASFERAA